MSHNALTERCDECDGRSCRCPPPPKCSRCNGPNLNAAALCGWCLEDDFINRETTIETARIEAAGFLLEAFSKFMSRGARGLRS